MHTHINTHIHTYIHTNVHTYKHTHTYVHTYKHTHIQTYTHVHTHIHRHTHKQCTPQENCEAVTTQSPTLEMCPYFQSASRWYQICNVTMCMPCGNVICTYVTGPSKSTM